MTDHLSESAAERVKLKQQNESLLADRAQLNQRIAELERYTSSLEAECARHASRLEAFMQAYTSLTNAEQFTDGDSGAVGYAATPEIMAAFDAASESFLVYPS